MYGGHFLRAILALVAQDVPLSALHPQRPAGEDTPFRVHLAGPHPAPRGGTPACAGYRRALCFSMWGNGGKAPGKNFPGGQSQCAITRLFLIVHKNDNSS